MRRRKTIAVVVLGASALTLGLAASVWFRRIAPPQVYFASMKFNSAEWKSTEPEMSWTSTRLRMVDDLLAKQNLVGRSREEIVELLGEPDDTQYFDTYDMVYFLGRERNSLMAIDGEWLVLRLSDSDKVIEAMLGSD